MQYEITIFLTRDEVVTAKISGPGLSLDKALEIAKILVEPYLNRAYKLEVKIG